MVLFHTNIVSKKTIKHVKKIASNNCLYFAIPSQAIE